MLHVQICEIWEIGAIGGSPDRVDNNPFQLHCIQCAEDGKIEAGKGGGQVYGNGIALFCSALCQHIDYHGSGIRISCGAFGLQVAQCRGNLCVRLPYHAGLIRIIYRGDFIAAVQFLFPDSRHCNLHTPGGVKHYRPVILSGKRFRLFENQKGNEQKQEYGQETPVIFQFHCATSQLCK